MSSSSSSSQPPQPAPGSMATIHLAQLQALDASIPQTVGLEQQVYDEEEYPIEDDPNAPPHLIFHSYPSNVHIPEFAKQFMPNTTSPVLYTAAPIIRLLVPSLAGATDDACAKYVERLCKEEPLSLLFAEHAKVGQPVVAVGAIVYRRYYNTFNNKKFHIEAMVVLPEHRSKGVGKALMDQLKFAARDNGSTEIVCQLATENVRAARFLIRERMDVKCFAFTGPAILTNGNNASSSVNASPSPGPIASPSPLPSQFTVRHVTDPEGKVTPEGEKLLRAAESVHRQLRVSLKEGTEAYLEIMKNVFSTGGRMIVAYENQEALTALPLAMTIPAGASSSSASSSSSTLPPPPKILGVCVYRFYKEFATDALHNWVDDLVSDSNTRSRGVGHALLEFVRTETAQRGIAEVTLDSGVQRKDAHRFYFRERMIIDAHSYTISIPKQEKVTHPYTNARRDV